MSTSNAPEELGQVLVDFSTNGTFPENESISAAHVDNSILPAALAVLQNAKEELETEIKQISRESAPDVEAWIAHAKSIQDDIQKSKKLANSIVRKAQADQERFEALQEKKNYAQFLTKEVNFQDQLLAALRSLQSVQKCLNEAEDLASRTNIVDALHQLEAAWSAMATAPMEKNTRALRLLDTKCFELRNHIQIQFSIVWKALIRADLDNRVLTITKKLDGQDTDLIRGMIALKAFHLVDETARKLWEDLDFMIIQPRTDIHSLAIPSIEVQDNTVSLGQVTDQTIKSLFSDLAKVIEFLVSHLPPELVQALASYMMPVLSRRLLDDWLDSAVPASLNDMVDYQKTLALVQDFARRLDIMKWPGSDGIHDWITGAPRIWLNKRREEALDWTRNQLSLGIGSPILAERVEKRMVGREEGDEIASATTGTAVTQEWDSAWDSEPELDEPPNAGTNHVPPFNEPQTPEGFVPQDTPLEDDDAADAWGWRDDDVDIDDAADPEPTPQGAPVVSELRAAAVPHASAIREMILSEKYWISSIPQAILTTIEKLYEDAAKLTQPETEHVPIAPAASGLFSLPTLVLAMYRAVSPIYYSNERGGNMFLYNDAMWLSEKFRAFIEGWNKRTDLSSRAYGMVKLDPEIKVLTSFAKRAYTNEMIEQRVLINDLLGGTQNFFQQDASQDKKVFQKAMKPVIQHVRDQAKIWKDILPYSAWASATGSLVNAIAGRVISDVLELSDIGADIADRIAEVIQQVESLNDLFIMKSEDGAPRRVLDEAKDHPRTANFADKWIKMQYLGEVLRGNLKDIKFLWFESELSLYFDADEVIELIGLSFEKNHLVRSTIREIRDNPYPKAGVEYQ